MGIVTFRPMQRLPYCPVCSDAKCSVFEHGDGDMIMARFLALSYSLSPDVFSLS